MKNDKKSAVTIASLITAAALCVSMVSCGKKSEIKTENKGLKGNDSLEYEVSRKDMEALESVEDHSEKEVPSKVSYDNDFSSDAAKDTDSEKDKKQDETASDDTSDAASEKGSDGGVQDDDLPFEVPYPDIEIFGDPNVGNDVALNIVNINGVTMDLFAETVDTLIAKTGTKQNKARAHYNYFNDEEAAEAYDGVFFYGKGYGVDAQTQDQSLRFTGTQFFIEGIRDGDELAMDVDARAEGVFGIRCLYSSLEDTNDFDVIYAGGVKCGMSRASVESILGEGSTSKRYTYYANGNNVLLLGYSGETVSDIYLVNDYERLPVRYSPSEKPKVEDESSEASSKIYAVPATDEYMQTKPSSKTQTARSRDEEDEEDQGE